jgi:hypothetical protein
MGFVSGVNYGRASAPNSPESALEDRWGQWGGFRGQLLQEPSAQNGGGGRRRPDQRAGAPRRSEAPGLLREAPAYLNKAQRERFRAIVADATGSATRIVEMANTDCESTCRVSGISPHAIRLARNKLIDAGLFAFNRQRSRYRILEARHGCSQARAAARETG